MGIFYVSIITAYLSDQVISGFTTGVAVHVCITQLHNVFNVTIDRVKYQVNFFAVFFVCLCVS